MPVPSLRINLHRDRGQGSPPAGREARSWPAPCRQV